MFRIHYNTLGLEQVKAIVAAGRGPVSAGALSDRLVSREIVLHLDCEGVEPPKLRYRFLSTDRLVLTENDGEPIECACGALDLGAYVLFAHMIPGTLRGYAVVLDTKTGRAAVEEMWFIDREGVQPDTRKKPLSMEELAGLGFFINREVERQIYRGYYTGDGREAAEGRFANSLRLDNKMVRWDDDMGRKRVFTYISNYFCTLVELDMPDGEDVLSLPCDYLQLDDSTFFFNFGEVEYSGRLSVEVLDLYTMRKIGVTMGIDENDRFAFSLYRAEGKYLGQYATFYDFDDRGDMPAPFMTRRLEHAGKGARSTYRVSVLSNAPTPEEIDALASNVGLFDEAGPNQMISDTRMAYSTQCVGKTVVFRDDGGFRAVLDFFEPERLRFRIDDGDWAEAQYRAFALDADLVYLGFYIEDSRPPRAMQFALDFANGCATCIDAVMAGGHDAHDVVPRYRFGTMETCGVTPPRTRRHGFTTELLGRSFTWTYSKGVTSQHIYNAPNSYSWTIFMGGQPGDPGYRTGGFVWSSPCTYIKLRNDVYIMTWVEEKWSGCMSSAAMNLRVMHDCGFIFSCTHDGSALYFKTLSALARDAGKCDLSGVYTLKYLG